MRKPPRAGPPRATPDDHEEHWLTSALSQRIIVKGGVWKNTEVRLNDLHCCSAQLTATVTRPG